MSKEIAEYLIGKHKKIICASSKTLSEDKIHKQAVKHAICEAQNVIEGVESAYINFGDEGVYKPYRSALNFLQAEEKEFIPRHAGKLKFIPKSRGKKEILKDVETHKH